MATVRDRHTDRQTDKQKSMLNASLYVAGKINKDVEILAHSDTEDVYANSCKIMLVLV